MPEICRFYDIAIEMIYSDDTSYSARISACITKNMRRLWGLMENFYPVVCQSDN